MVASGLAVVVAAPYVVGGALAVHTTYSRNDMGQKCEGNCGLDIIKKNILKI